ncbi:MAG: hypothetical protein BGO49_24610 [Planctomycetales bacterium 71-10]|nr:MAG: hypothetical protein BGO49_24610 [Planctomycetales bacterium 71-10]
MKTNPTLFARRRKLNQLNELLRELWQLEQYNLEDWRAEPDPEDKARYARNCGEYARQIDALEWAIGELKRPGIVRRFRKAA